ncbi:hypothetical protein [Porphyrobacter sp. TH134]|uniref:hypothetical protein n=1 Tax=Porphyrobacter sp. TH134 TaxID=2067450 RepID=UPI00117F988B|nr:hypothetical protein [Porphyrobacter sp. TH134]
MTRSLALAAGVEKITPLLPDRSKYSDSRPPCVKWIFLPNRRGDLNDWENNVQHSYWKFREIYEELQPHHEFLRMGYTHMGEKYGEAFWLWEDIRPTVSWVSERLPLIYVMAHACDCNLEGWTFEDDHAWAFGLADVINEAGFDPEYTRPGQMS